MWALLEDFGAIERWWPKDGPIRIASVANRRRPASGWCGTSCNEGASRPIDERLDFLDRDARRWCSRSSGSGPSGLTGYLAEGEVVDLGDGTCRMNYRVLFTIEPTLDEQQVRRGLLATYAMMFSGLEAAARRD